MNNLGFFPNLGLVEITGLGVYGVKPLFRHWNLENELVLPIATENTIITNWTHSWSATFSIWGRSLIIGQVSCNCSFKHWKLLIGIINFIHFFKGQLIWECLLGVIDFPKKQRKIWQISALKSKKWSNQQSKSTFL